MNQTSVLAPIAPTVEKTTVSEEPEYVLNVVAVYQDASAQKWATEICDQVMQLVGRENISVTSWKISDLTRPSTLANAVSSAARADVIVVSVTATEELPLDLYVWIDAWLPRHAFGMGALVALISLPQEPAHQAFSTQEYLQAVAHKGGLDFFPRERVRPVAASDFFGIETMKGGADSWSPALAGIASVSDDHCRDWGIND